MPKTVKEFFSLMSQEKKHDEILTDDNIVVKEQEIEDQEDIQSSQQEIQLAKNTQDQIDRRASVSAVNTKEEDNENQEKSAKKLKIDDFINKYVDKLMSDKSSERDNKAVQVEDPATEPALEKDTTPPEELTDKVEDQELEIEDSESNMPEKENSDMDDPKLKPEDIADQAQEKLEQVAGDESSMEDGTGESVIKMIIEMSVFKGLQNVSDDFGKSFNIDPYTVLAIFQKTIMNPENLTNASKMIAKLISSQKQQEVSNAKPK